MYVFKTNKDLIYFLDNERIKGNKIGFVPTMGALHQGHLALLGKALKENETCVCSIYVNPTQFNNLEDLERYPRTVEDDLLKLEKEGCQSVFLPGNEELYDNPSSPRTTLRFGEIENVLEGSFRPGHLRGVGLVVTKLFNIVKPDNAYFGQKDLQQFVLVKQLIHDLSYNIGLHCLPTVREPDGLAYSSRNLRIDPDHRPLAGKFHECLQECSKQLFNGLDPGKLTSFAEAFFSLYDPLRLEYIALVDTENFRILDLMDDAAPKAICIAGYVGNIRLIDNVLLN